MNKTISELVDLSKGRRPKYGKDVLRVLGKAGDVSSVRVKAFNRGELAMLWGSSVVTMGELISEYTMMEIGLCPKTASLENRIISRMVTTASSIAAIEGELLS